MSLSNLQRYFQTSLVTVDNKMINKKILNILSNVTWKSVTIVGRIKFYENVSMNHNLENVSDLVKKDSKREKYYLLLN